MARALWLADALRAEGVNVIEVAGWQERGSSTFTPKAVLAHHTASAAGSNAPGLGICINGRSDLPGPLAQVVLARNGDAYVIASGRANHAGKGEWKGVSGNSNLLGIEAENNGVGESWSDKQMDAYVRVVAAMLRYLKLSAEFVAAHYEYAQPKGRKIDPKGNVDFMTGFRAKVAQRLKGGNTPAPKPTPVEDDEMTKEDREMLQAIALKLQALENEIIGIKDGPKKDQTRMDRLSDMVTEIHRAVIK